MISRYLAIALIGCGLFDCQLRAGDGDSAGEGVIDSMLDAAQSDAGVVPAELCDDATFVRRLSLDLLGRVPSVAELQAFVADPDRDALIERMLNDPDHAAFWSQLWTTTLIGRTQQQYIEREVLRRWLEEKIRSEESLQQIAYELISAEGVTSLEGPVNFIAASRADPVMRLSRTFLSVQLDCAECHDHPYDRWSNDDYVAVKRFFAPTRFREVSGGMEVRDEAPARGSERPVFLTGSSASSSAWRQELGLMVVQSKPFSRAMVNRTWSWLMGRGLVDPVDGWSRANPGIAPDLLEELAMTFRQQNFALRPLIRSICSSDAYQRGHHHAEAENASDLNSLFAVRQVRPQSPEQWIGSIATILSQPQPAPDVVADRAERLMGLTERTTSADPYLWTPTTQTLVRELTTDLSPPNHDVDELFLAALARRPTEAERKLMRNESTREILFALVHCNEFLMND